MPPTFCHHPGPASLGFGLRLSILSSSALLSLKKLQPFPLLACRLFWTKPSSSAASEEAKHALPLQLY